MTYSIIGGGIGGLTTALAFEKKGIEYSLFERFSNFTMAGAGIWLSPNSLQVFESLGLFEEIASKGNSIDRITIGKPDLSPISDNLQDPIKKRFGYSSIAIHRFELQKILLDKLPKEKIHLGASFDSFQYTEEDKVRIKFADGSTALSDYLIGADGIKSKVREQLFPGSQIRYSGQTCWRGVAQLELDERFDNRVYELWGDQIRFGFSRISAGKYYWFAVALSEPNLKDKKHYVREKLLTLFHDFDPVVTQLLKATEPEDILRNDINDLKPLKKWHQNKVCLLGDAGHATTPNMGQGGAQAVEDAHYLSHIIDNPMDGNKFESFQKRRESKVNSIVNQSWTTGKLAHWKYGTGLRNLAMGLLPKSILLKKMIQMYEIDKF